MTELFNVTRPVTVHTNTLVSVVGALDRTVETPGFNITRAARTRTATATAARAVTLTTRRSSGTDWILHTTDVNGTQPTFGVHFGRYWVLNMGGDGTPTITNRA